MRPVGHVQESLPRSRACPPGLPGHAGGGVDAGPPDHARRPAAGAPRSAASQEPAEGNEREVGLRESWMLIAPSNSRKRAKALETFDRTDPQPKLRRAASNTLGPTVRWRAQPPQGRSLQVAPPRRLDVDAALAQPYLADLHDPGDEPTAQCARGAHGPWQQAAPLFVLVGPTPRLAAHVGRAPTCQPEKRHTL